MLTNTNDYLTKQINGNYTPDPEQRKEYTDIVTDIKIGLSIGSTVLGGPYVEQIQGAAKLLETGAVFAYDSAPEKANNTIDEIKKFISSFNSKNPTT